MSRKFHILIPLNFRFLLMFFFKMAWQIKQTKALRDGTFVFYIIVIEKNNEQDIS